MRQYNEWIEDRIESDRKFLNLTNAECGTNYTISAERYNGLANHIEKQIANPMLNMNHPHIIKQVNDYREMALRV